MAEKSRLKSTLFIGGLDNQVTQMLLYEAFIPFGEIVEVTLPKPDLPNSSDPHRGFGYIEFEDSNDAKEAIYNMDQSEIFGRVVKVAAAKPQKEANEGLGSKTAIWEQVRHSEHEQLVLTNEDDIGRISVASRDPRWPTKQRTSFSGSYARFRGPRCRRTSSRIVSTVSRTIFTISDRNAHG